VFADRPLTGNGLTVVTPTAPLAAETMLRIAQEMRQFETLFLFGGEGTGVTARIFTPEEELFFAGHPILGAAAVMHLRSGSVEQRHEWTIGVGERLLKVTTDVTQDGLVEAEMDQGAPVLHPVVSRGTALEYAAALGLGPEQVLGDLPAQVVSTGLAYLLLPVTPEGLSASRVVVPDLPARLRAIGADFVYVLDPHRPEGRTWDNSGTVEDVATGSAAGPTAAYLVTRGLRPAESTFHVHQGRFVGRPSRMRVRRASDGAIHVGGAVAAVSSGTMEPSALTPH